MKLVPTKKWKSYKMYFQASEGSDWVFRQIIHARSKDEALKFAESLEIENDDQAVKVKKVR